jgi:RNA polymerase sigma factor (TIGR02999 family)
MPESESPGEVTALLWELKQGNKEALDKLIPLVYSELHRVADRYLRAERAGHTLQPTALVHEAWLCISGLDRADWQNRAQFIGVAAQIMRRILVDYARARGTAKRGGAASRAHAYFEVAANGPEPEEILAVDEALERLAVVDPLQARVAELRYFTGLTIEETAEAMGISDRTVKREWTMAAAWLRAELSGKGGA